MRLTRGTSTPATRRSRSSSPRVAEQRANTRAPVNLTGALSCRRCIHRRAGLQLFCACFTARTPAIACRLGSTWWARRESNPHDLSASGFSCHHGFRRQPALWLFVVWTIPSPTALSVSGAPRLVSTPSLGKPRAWLGASMPFPVQPPPNLRRSTPGVSPGALNCDARGMRPPRLPFRHSPMLCCQVGAEATVSRRSV
jgi:hypothetical protein